MTVRIGTTPRIGVAQAVGRDAAATRAVPTVPTRALVVLEGGRSEAPRGAGASIGARPDAGFLAQLVVAHDPSLRPSRLERTRSAAALYAQTARRLA